MGPSMDEVLFSAIQMEDERQDSNPYIDCSFILATAVIVERLWSVAGRLLSATRRSMTPEIFEAILFLHINRDFWDDELVYKAIALAKEARVKIRSQKKKSAGIQENGTVNKRSRINQKKSKNKKANK